jgi:hypothetical protein
MLYLSFVDRAMKSCSGVTSSVASSVSVAGTVRMISSLPAAAGASGVARDDNTKKAIPHTASAATPPPATIIIKALL